MIFICKCPEFRNRLGRVFAFARQMFEFDRTVTNTAFNCRRESLAVLFSAASHRAFPVRRQIDPAWDGTGGEGDFGEGPVERRTGGQP